MKTMKWKFYSLAFVAGMSILTACSSDDNNDNDGNGGNGNGNEIENGTILKGTITSDVTLAAGNTYKLSGEYIVEEGATLHIEEGVKIIAVYDDIADYILVKQGGKINAVGTPDKPIVMTSEKEEPGAWGGIHICGRAHTNAEGGKGSSEIGGAVYGGNDDADNSGTLQYIRLEYTGFAFDEEHEANGISFYGVGNGTIVDHCQAYKGSDDGFEFFGGSVNVSNLVAVSCSDDSFDWTEGWNGKGTNLVAYQEAESTLGYDCDCLMECDNNGSNNAATPVAHPVLKNLILVGNGGSKQGIRLRAGTEVEIDNAKVCGKGQPLTVETALTENALKNGTSKLTNITLTSELSSKEGIRLRAGTEVEIDNAKVCGKGQPLTVETALTENALKNGTSKLTNITLTSELSSKEGIYTHADFIAVTSNKVDANLSYSSFEDIKKECSWMNGSWVK